VNEKVAGQEYEYEEEEDEETTKKRTTDAYGIGLQSNFLDEFRVLAAAAGKFNNLHIIR
jgi:hypothetical protein